jgi:hypothetical protein
MTLKTIPIVSEKPVIMVGCGILHKEVDFLIKKNGWNVETQFLASALHNYFDQLYNQLNDTLTFDESKGRETIVFYGACHPRMDDILTKHHTHRTQGQNCIVMLLGFEKFMEELSNGTYFLVEDWALTWEPMLTECFGKNPAVVREIFHSSHKMIMALRTPCSTDFTAAAQAAADFVDLPLIWKDVSLDHLEAVLLESITRKNSPTS